MVERPFRLRTCRSIREQLSAFLDDEVADADAMDISRHVARCEDCASELEDVRIARDAVRALPPLHAPAALAQPPLATPRRRPLALLGAAGALVGAAAVFVAGGTGGEVVPPVDDLVVDHVTNTGGDFVLTPVRVER